MSDLFDAALELGGLWPPCVIGLDRVKWIGGGHPRRSSGGTMLPIGIPNAAPIQAGLVRTVELLTDEGRALPPWS
jgi:hypothetical protein